MERLKAWALGAWNWARDWAVGLAALAWIWLYGLYAVCRDWVLAHKRLLIVAGACLLAGLLLGLLVGCQGAPLNPPEQEAPQCAPDGT